MPAAAPLDFVAAALEVVVAPEEPDVPDEVEDPEEPDELEDPEGLLPLLLEVVPVGAAAAVDVEDDAAFTAGQLILNLGVVERLSVMAN